LSATIGMSLQRSQVHDAPMNRTVAERVNAVSWKDCFGQLDAEGWSILPRLLSEAECDLLAKLYGPTPTFRSQVIMSRHGFGRGEYRYFSYPLPPLVQQLRETLYGRLVPIANEWKRRMGEPAEFPNEHAAYVKRCNQAGQHRPTPLLLRYGPGDYNCLHQDLYGAESFPLQVAVLLSAPQQDFEGGEFVITEQRPRMQTRAAVVPLSKGDGVVFAVSRRPARGARGDYRVTMRHGVSRLQLGQRSTLGIIFHEAA
jgi:hypothetical protein